MKINTYVKKRWDEGINVFKYELILFEFQLSFAD